MKIKKRFLSILLSLALMLGLLPGMSMMAYATTYSDEIWDDLQVGDILKPGARYFGDNITVILQANGWGNENEMSTSGKQFSVERRGLEIRDNGCIEVEGDDYTYTYCYPYVNDVKVSAWKVVSVNIGDDYSTTITLTGYAPPAREPEMTFSSDTILTEDINGYVTINGNVTLDLAGHTITGGGNYGTIYVNNGCTLTLKDSSADKTGTITGGGGDTGGGVAVSVNATFNMQGGTITGNSATQGGGVYSSGTFNMSGGTISNNNATGGFEGVGGGVVIQSGNFTMSGTAAITGNSSGDFGNGGGVYFAGTTFTMSGGSITQNSGFYGAGVYMDRGTLNMSGNASISSNTASGCSGGVQVRDYATLNMSGNAAIANNRASYEGGAIYLDGTLTMTDSASITGNSTSDKSAGGICVHSGNLKIGGGVKISGNTRNGSAEDVDLYPGKVITVTAALTEETPITVRRSDSNGHNYGEGVITANNGSSYTVQESDKAKFSPASSGQRVKWVDGQARLINLYRVTYNPNGATSGTVPTDENNPYESGSTVTVLGNTGNLAKTSHNFNGWNTAANGRGTSYAADATFNIERNTTLYAQWEEVPHVHSFTYEADGATITATCTAEGCTLPEVGGKHVATLTIAAPALTTYGGTESAEATIIDANSIQGDAKVQYQKKSGESYGTATEIAPTDAGDYKASITVGGVTASVEYTIAQADPTANAPTGLTATYGQTLADVSLEGKNSEGNTPGTWTWANNTQSVGDVVTPAATFKATFTPNSSNYKTVENVDVSVTVGKADPTAPTGLIATYGQTLADVTLPDGWTWADSTQSVGNVVDPATTFKANFAVNDNYNAASNVDVSVMVGKADQTAPTGLTATKASSNSAADGKISGVTSAMEYQIDGASAWTAVGENKTEITDLAAGTYKVRYAETANENASPEATIQVGVKEDQTAPAGLTATKASSSTAADGKISNVTDAMEYQKDGDTSWTAVENGKTEITGLTAGTYKVRYAGTADKNASDATSVEVGTKTDQTAPTGLTATKASSSTATDGKISGVTATMEYQIDGATTWTAVGENQTEITGLTAGTYKVRYAGTADKNASPVSTVEVGVKVAPTVTAPTAKPLTYNGQAQELVIAGSTEDGTLYYAVTAENIAPTDDSLYTTFIPSKTDAGTYYVWYKVIGDENHADSETKCVTVTIGRRSSGGGSSGGSSSSPSTPTTPTESYTIPVSGENTVNVPASISNETAVVSDISQSEIDKIIDAGNSTGTNENISVTIDLSQAKSEVTSVQLTKDTVEKLTEAVNENNNVERVEIKMSKATVELDAKALSAVSEQAEGNSIKLVVKDTQTTKLNTVQQESLKQFTSAQPFQAYFESKGKEIHDFKGGKATVSIKFSPETGKDVKYYHMYYLPLAGAIERYETRYIDGMLNFVTGHFSDYAIVYDETRENETGKEDEADNTDTDDNNGTDNGKTTANGKTAYQNALSINKGLKVSQTGNKITVSWGKVSGADRYEIYAAYCTDKFGKKPVKIITKKDVTSVTITKLNGKKLVLTKNFKAYVVAYKTVDGSKKKLGKTITAHIVGRKNKTYTNVKAIKLAKNKATIKVGKTYKIKASVVLVDSKKKMLSDKHAATFRYASSNKKIAAVDKNGKVIAKKVGTCYIWVYAKNGYAKKVKITVK